MNQEQLSVLKHIQSVCKKDFSRFEFWPAYFERRFTEFLSYEQLFPVKQFGKVLEVGCGNGFYSCLLSKLSDEVVASDLEDPTLDQHAHGLQNAREMIAAMGFPNIKLQGASIEAIPFPDNSFDMVFASHVLIYLGDKTKALQEVNRVLKPGGYFICIVPTRASKVYNLLLFQVYILKRAFYHLLLKHFERKQKVDTVAVKNSAELKSRPINLSSLKDYPFPPPFGGLKHWKDEFREWSPDGWRGLLEEKGGLRFVSQSTTQINPLLPILGESFHYLAAAIYAYTWRIESRLGRLKFFQRFGLNSIIILQK